jgi:hypothetical protein
MSKKHQSTERANGQKPSSGHGSFKHTAKPATLKEVLGAYGLKQADYRRVRSIVLSHLHKEPAHAR